MALIRCPDCGRSVSDQAAACPDCARPIADSRVVAPGPTQPSGPTDAEAERSRRLQAEYERRLTDTARRRARGAREAEKIESRANARSVAAIVVALVITGVVVVPILVMESRRKRAASRAVDSETHQAVVQAAGRLASAVDQLVNRADPELARIMRRAGMEQSARNLGTRAMELSLSKNAVRLTAAAIQIDAFARDQEKVEKVALRKGRQQHAQLVRGFIEALTGLSDALTDRADHLLAAR